MTREELGLGAEDEDIEILKKTYEDTSHDTDESLIRTGRLFGGLMLDIKRKSKWFISDFKDALHMQSLAAIIYIYLATITKAITFGGFLGDITDRKQVRKTFHSVEISVFFCHSDFYVKSIWGI